MIRLEFPDMTSAVPDILARIVGHKQAELPALRLRRAEWERLASGRTERRDFRAALTGRTPAIIAEIKKASPSKGLLAPDFDPVRIARQYESGGAAALSILTDEAFFQGSLADLETARTAVSLPVLRKDFTLEECHIAQAAAHGADSVLLIAALLKAPVLRRLREYAEGYGLTALIEVHDAAELRQALDSGATVIGINNRDLHTFQVKLETSLELAARIPAGVVRVSESGIFTAADIARLRSAGFHAFLIGESLMKSADPSAALRELTA
jgi:indole-3-glycerol phosphate synthase